MKRVNVVDENGEAGSFLTPHPFLSLTGNIFDETEAALHDISKRIKKLSHFVGDAVVGQHDCDELNDSKTDRQQKQADRQRQWQLGKLRHINGELYHQIGDMLRIKLEVLDAIERLRMAELEKSVENELSKRKSSSSKLVKRAERTSQDIDDWVPARMDNEK
jgi:hypothetical protein